MSGTYVQALGGFRLLRDEQPLRGLTSKKAIALLAYLVIHRGHVVPRDRLAALLWSDADPPHARQSLRQAVLVLRQALGPQGEHLLSSRRSTLSLDPGGLRADVWDFERDADHGSAEALAAAVRHYRGDLLHGFSFAEIELQEWLVIERGRLRGRAIDVLLQLLARYQAEGALAAVKETALRLLSLNPIEEAAHRALMRAHAAEGRVGLAARQFFRCREMLWQELAIEPEEETRALFDAIRRRRDLPGERPARHAPMQPAARSGRPLHDLPAACGE